jgi:2-keto-4-pentenoate hydratase/2-oxohepta-3-ene-1,7-dioic acid hydratase in catechol pathway
MNRRSFFRLAGIVLVVVGVATVARSLTAQAALSDKPDNPFKLATFEINGKLRVGLVLGTRILDIEAANAYVTKQARLQTMAVPTEMKTLIEQYAVVSPRLYQIANYFKTNSTANLPFASDFEKAALKAPILYPWNLLAAAANYRAHAAGMAGNTEPAATPQAASGGRGNAPAGFDASAADRIVPDRDAPIMFAKSARSCIIDPNEPFYIVDGRQRTDYEGEMAIVMGPRPAYRVPKERAHDFVFGYSIANDVSDRGSERLREVTMFPGTNWFDGKSIDRAAPFGPAIVPKEFLPKAPGNLRITTKVNGETLQDANTNQLIWDEAHLVSYLSSRLTLYPGDVILTGTPSGTGAERQKFLKPGDIVAIELEGVGTLTTPFEALSQKPAPPTQ